MVDIAAFRPRRRAAHAAELAVDRHEIDQGGADAELVEADGFLFLLPAGAQYVDVEAGHAVQIDDAQNDMVYGLDRDHACSTALTPGSSLPSIHSRKAPPAVETKVKSSATPAWLTAATVSPPPATETTAPSLVARTNPRLTCATR